MKLIVFVYGGIAIHPGVDVGLVIVVCHNRCQCVNSALVDQTTGRLILILTKQDIT